MPDFRQANFGSGEFGPSLWGADYLQAYGAACRTLRNMYVSKARTPTNRAGTVFCHEVKDSTKFTRLFPFNFSSGQAYVVEAGDKNFRISRADGTLIEAAALLATSNPCARSLDNGASWAATASSGLTVSYTGAPCELANGRVLISGLDGTTPAIAYTDDLGLTWTKIQIPGIGVNQTLTVAAFNGRRVFVACGMYAAGKWAYSDDNGATWTVVPTPAGLLVMGIEWGRDRWIAVGSNASVAKYSFSFDGNTWSAPSSVGDLDASASSSVLWAVRYCAGVFLAVGQANPGGANKHLLCTIGVLGSNWSWQVGTDVGGGCQMFAIATDGTNALAVGSITGTTSVAYSYSSSTGKWTKQTPPANSFFYGVAYQRGVYVCVGGFAGLASHACVWDGANWTTPAMPGGTGAIYLGITTGKGSNTLELTPPYASSEIRDLAFCQSGDIETIFHQSYAPRELRRYGLHDWRIEAWYKTPPTRVVTGLGFATPPTQGSDTTHVEQPWEVVVTWEDEATGRESLGSAALIATGSGKYQRYPDRTATYSWDTVEKAKRYHIYVGQNGRRGYVGSADQPAAAAGVFPATVSWLDKGQAPVWSENPPVWTNPFQSDLSYPTAGGYMDDRFDVVGALVQPSLVKGSRVADYYNFDEPFLSDVNSPFSFNLTARRYEDPRWVVPLEFLVIGTSESLWVVAGDPSGGAISQSNIFARARARRGCAKIQPVLVGNGIVYVEDGGQVLRFFKPTRELTTEADPAVYGGVELSINAGHLFENATIVDMAMSHSPEPVIWIVRSDGALLSLTFNPENGTVAWARHDSDGDAFEAVTTVPNGSYEVPFFVVRRTVNGATKRYVEYLPQRSITNVFLDCAVAKTQASSSTITGLGHLEGRTVGVLADGTYRGTCVVAGGQVTFTGGAATNVVAGLPIVADWEPLDFPQARDRVKVVATVGVEYRQNPPVADPAAGLRIGPDAAGAQASDIRKFSDARDGVLRVAVDRSYGPGARVFLRHTQPFPLEIRGVTREVRA